MEVSPHLIALGHDVLVVGSSLGRSSDEAGPVGVNIRNIPLKANGVASIPFDFLSLISVARWADAVFLLGVSAGPLVPFMRRLVREGNLIVNVDGLESRRMKWSPLGKRYLAWAEKIAIRGARHVVADNDAIADIISREHRRASTTIAYGGDHVRQIDPVIRSQVLSELGLQENGFFLTVARIEPENNIDMMLDAACAQSGCPYVIVGNFSGTDYGKEIWNKYSIFSNIRLIPSNYDPNVLAALRSGCRAYLHGHSVGGTNPSLVEVLPYNRPVIAYDCSFNRCTMNGTGAYFKSTEELKSILKSDDLLEYKPPETVRDDPRYRWRSIAQHYAALAANEISS